HDPGNYYTDTRSRPGATSLGVGWTGRNAPTLVDVAYYRWAGWAGKDDTLWAQGANVPELAAPFASDRCEYAHMVYRKYRADYNALFSVPLDAALDPASPDAARFPATGKPKP